MRQIMFKNYVLVQHLTSNKNYKTDIISKAQPNKHQEK